MPMAHGPALCGGPVVELQEATQPRTTRNRPVAASRPLDGEEQPVVHALMIAFVMIVLNEFVDDVPERAFANEHQLRQTRFLDRPDEAFGQRVEIGRTGRQAAVSTPAADNVSAKASVNRGSLSWRRNRTRIKPPSRLRVECAATRPANLVDAAHRGLQTQIQFAAEGSSQAAILRIRHSVRVVVGCVCELRIRTPFCTNVLSLLIVHVRSTEPRRVRCAKESIIQYPCRARTRIPGRTADSGGL